MIKKLCTLFRDNYNYFRKVLSSWRVEYNARKKRFLTLKFKVKVNFATDSLQVPQSNQRCRIHLWQTFKCTSNDHPVSSRTQGYLVPLSQLKFHIVSIESSSYTSTGRDHLFPIIIDSRNFLSFRFLQRTSDIYRGNCNSFAPVWEEGKGKNRIRSRQAENFRGKSMDLSPPVPFSKLRFHLLSALVSAEYSGRWRVYLRWISPSPPLAPFFVSLSSSSSVFFSSSRVERSIISS